MNDVVTMAWAILGVLITVAGDPTGFIPSADQTDMLSFWISIVALAGGLISIAGVIWLSATRLAKIEVKVDTMWAFQMRRAFTEAMDKGIATVNSPLRFSIDAQDRLEPIRPELEEFWATTKDTYHNDAEVLLAIESRFGQRLIEKVCIPCSLTHGACLLLAYAIATGRQTIDFSRLVLDPSHDRSDWEPPLSDDDVQGHAMIILEH